MPIYVYYPLLIAYLTTLSITQITGKLLHIGLEDIGKEAAIP